MRLLLGILLVTAAFLSGTSAAWAQPYDGWTGGPDPRAYQQFLHSNSSYRTYSYLGSGHAVERYGPFSYERSYIDPGYIQQRITPRGFESYSWIPGRGADVATPFGGSGYYLPGHPYQYFIPAVPPR